MEHLPVILIEVVLFFGGAMAFGWWQLRTIKRDREAAARRKAEAAQATNNPATTEGG